MPAASKPPALNGALSEPPEGVVSSAVGARPDELRVTSSRLSPVSEINTSLDDAYAWVSPDGLKIYFTREDRKQEQTPHTYRASRTSVDASFDKPVVVNSLRQAVLSDDGLTMVGHVGDPGLEQLLQTDRLRTADDFPPPTIIASLSARRGAKSPWLSEDGLTLYFQDKASGGMTVACRRASRQMDWPQPGLLASIDDQFYSGGPRTWLSFSQGGLILFFCKGGTRDSQVFCATRASQQEAFESPQQVLVDGAPLIGRAPRYVASTRELYISSTSEKGDFDLLVLKDFTP